MGVIAAVTFFIFKTLYEKLKIDDVTDQIAIHFGCGLIGTILTLHLPNCLELEESTKVTRSKVSTTLNAEDQLATFQLLRT